MATGETLVTFGTSDDRVNTSNPTVRTRRNGHWVMAFDATTNQTSVVGSIMPRHYGGGGLTVYLHYAMATATSGDIDWDVSFERIGDQQQDIDSDNFATPQPVDNTTVPASAGLVDIVSVAFTDGAQMASIAVGEYFRMRVTRDAASDTATGNAQLLAIEIKET